MTASTDDMPDLPASLRRTKEGDAQVKAKNAAEAAAEANAKTKAAAEKKVDGKHGTKDGAKTTSTIAKNAMKEEAPKKLSAAEKAALKAKEKKIKEAGDKEAEKARKKAEKEAAEKLKAQEEEAAEKQAAKAKEKAEKEAKAGLETEAKNINARNELVQKYEGKADDHRIAMAIHLDNARKNCATLGLKFEKWCEDNLQIGYEMARKLAAIGKAGEGEEDKVRLALEDSRNKNKEANKKAREKAKKETDGEDEGEGDAPARTIPSDLESLQAAFERLDDKRKAAFLGWAAELVGAALSFED